MRCAQARELLSSYVDRELPPKQARAAWEHLAGCADCSARLALLQQTRRLVSALGPKKAPANLELQLRVAISREVAGRRQRMFQGMLTRWQNALEAFLWPATAGVLSAVIIFSLLMGFFALPARLEASQNTDIPSMLYTPPELRFSPVNVGMDAINADSLVVEAYIDANGRVQDYRIISAPPDSESLMPQLKNVLIFTQFRPATSFGRPTISRAVLSFSKISVKG
jgi:hypothetical protein